MLASLHLSKLSILILYYDPVLLVSTIDILYRKKLVYLYEIWNKFTLSKALRDTWESRMRKKGFSLLTRRYFIAKWAIEHLPSYKMSRSNGILSPVQTNFNENSLPAKLNPSQKRSLFCILLSFPVSPPNFSPPRDQYIDHF